MREDMFKVIVECRRRGPRGGNRGAARVANDFDDTAVPMTGRRYATLRGEHRHLNENLNPLKRYIGRQVGRRWDKVYAEICATLDANSTVKEHVRGHAEDYVAKPRIRRDGSLAVENCRFGRAGALPWYERYYVDPRDGILKESDRLWAKLGLDRRPWRSRERKPDPDSVWLRPGEILQRIAGIWYHLVLGEVSSRDTESDAPRATLTVLGSRPYTDHEVHYRLLAKRQLGRKELAAFGLRNDT